jgi:hypothetical protein
MQWVRHRRDVGQMPVQARRSAVTRVISHSDCPSADLIVDAVYEGGQTKDVGSDAISRVMPGSGNQGGFRAAGTGEDKKFVVLYTSGEDRDWPDDLELNTGQFVYFGVGRPIDCFLHASAAPARRDFEMAV